MSKSTHIIAWMGHGTSPPPPVGVWILETSFWVDSGTEWLDTSNWID